MLAHIKQYSYSYRYIDSDRQTFGPMKNWSIFADGRIS